MFRSLWPRREGQTVGRDNRNWEAREQAVALVQGSDGGGLTPVGVLWFDHTCHIHLFRHHKA